MSAMFKPAVRKRIVMGWRQLERERAAIRRRQRSTPSPKRVS